MEMAAVHSEPPNGKARLLPEVTRMSGTEISGTVSKG